MATTRTNWEELYQDLPENVAKILREKRVKPDQLTAKTDGEILAYGLSDADLETIRAKYKPEIQSEPIVVVHNDTPSGSDVGAHRDALSVSNSHFARFPRHLHGRSTHYKVLAKKINSNQALAPREAIEKLVALAGNGRGLDLHLNTIETGIRGETKVPFSTGKTIRIEIFSDKTITALNNNEIAFDVLLAIPADMAKLARYAKILGPKGLMPNPKSGTVTIDPEGRAKQLNSGATISYKSEPKFPIIHISLGKTNQKPEELTANLIAIIKDINPTKIKSAYLTSTQTPSVRLDLTSL